MKLNLTSLELSQQLKEIGFDKPCFGYYNTTWFDPNKIQFPEYGIPDNWNIESHLVSATNWTDIVDWFYQNHKMWLCVDISPITFRDENDNKLPFKFYYRIDDVETNDIIYHSGDDHKFYFDPNEARTEIILKSIEIIKINEI